MTKADALEVRIYLFRMGLLLVLTVCASVSVFWLMPIQPAQVLMIAIFVGGFAALILTKHWTMDHTILKTQQVLDLAESGVAKLAGLRDDVMAIERGRARQLEEIAVTAKATYTLCNTQYGAALQSLANVTLRLAEVSESEADQIAAAQAAAAVREHEAKQALVAVTAPVPVAEVAATLGAVGGRPPSPPVSDPVPSADPDPIHDDVGADVHESGPG